MPFVSAVLQSYIDRPLISRVYNAATTPIATARSPLAGACTFIAAPVLEALASLPVEAAESDESAVEVAITVDDELRTVGVPETWTERDDCLIIISKSFITAIQLQLNVEPCAEKCYRTRESEGRTVLLLDTTIVPSS